MSQTSDAVAVLRNSVGEITFFHLVQHFSKQLIRCGCSA